MVKVPYGQGQRPEPLVSRKVASCEARTEGSEPTDSGTDE